MHDTKYANIYTYIHQDIRRKNNNYYVINQTNLTMFYEIITVTSLKILIFVRRISRTLFQSYTRFKLLFYPSLSKPKYEILPPGFQP